MKKKISPLIDRFCTKLGEKQNTVRKNFAVCFILNYNKMCAGTTNKKSCNLFNTDTKSNFLYPPNSLWAGIE